MKKVMIAGGLLGFLIGVTFGLVQGSSWPSILWRASVATAVAGMLMRWWGNFLVASLQAAHAERLSAAAAMAAAPAPIPASGSGSSVSGLLGAASGAALASPAKRNSK
jgi:hypothetical protein